MKIALALVLLLILFSIASVLLLVKEGSANPLPPVYPTITMDVPQNATFTNNSIVLNFTGRSNWDIYSYYYSVDGQSLKPVENIAIVSQEEANIGKNPNVNRTTVQGSFILQNLSTGWHNVTIYNIATEDFIWNSPQYKTGETMCQIDYSFRIREDALSIALITVAIAATTSVCLLVYFKKRKK